MLKYTQLVSFEATDVYVCRVGETKGEISALIESGLEYMCEDNARAPRTFMIILRGGNIKQVSSLLGATLAIFRATILKLRLLV